MNIKEMIGQTYSRVKKGEYDTLEFIRSDGVKHVFFHDQSCCEQVYIEDICGDLKDLEKSSILVAEEVSNNTPCKKGDEDDMFQWTFYKFATAKGHVTVRWYGTSNGYYSIDVELEERHE